MKREFILSEIHRTAAANDGKPLGWRKFLAETGIKESDWLGVHWARWSDALRDAGLEPNQLTAAIPEATLLRHLATLAVELQRVPNKGDLRFKQAHDSGFPTDKVFDRLGPQRDRIRKLLAYCLADPQYHEVARLCEAFQPRIRKGEDEPQNSAVEFGVVYMLKAGKHFKIGRSNSVGRREYEIALQLPERATTVHVIQTDDPAGIEAYWHRRFESKRANGEWFALHADDVAAFKRRKFM